MCRFAVLRRLRDSVGCLLYPTIRLQNGRAVLRLRIHRSGGCDGVLRHISTRRNIGNSALSHLYSIGSLLSAVGEILVSNNKGKTRCGCTRRAAQSGLQDERRLALLRLGTLRLSHTLVYGFPESVGSIGLEVAEAVVYVFFPISLHSRKELLVLYCFIFLASIAFALCSCDADVLSFMPSSEAISLWLLSSTT